MRAALVAFHDPVAAGRVADARRFGGDQALVVDDVEDRGLNKLGFHDGRNDLYHGLSGEHKGALRNSVDTSGEMEIGKICEKIFLEDAQAAQIFDILVAEVKLFDVFDELLNTAHDGISTTERVVAEEGIEDDHAVFFLILEVALHHCQLIEICEQCQVLSVHFFSSD